MMLIWCAYLMAIFLGSCVVGAEISYETKAKQLLLSKNKQPIENGYSGISSICIPDYLSKDGNKDTLLSVGKKETDSVLQAWQNSFSYHFSKISPEVACIIFSYIRRLQIEGEAEAQFDLKQYKLSALSQLQSFYRAHEGSMLFRKAQRLFEGSFTEKMIVQFDDQERFFLCSLFVDIQNKKGIWCGARYKALWQGCQPDIAVNSIMLTMDEWQKLHQLLQKHNLEYNYHEYNCLWNEKPYSNNRTLILLGGALFGLGIFSAAFGTGCLVQAATTKQFLIQVPTIISIGLAAVSSVVAPVVVPFVHTSPCCTSVYRVDKYIRKKDEK